MRKVGPGMLIDKLSEFTGNVLCCVCRWHICIVLVNVQALKDGAPEQYKQWVFIGIQPEGTS